MLAQAAQGGHEARFDFGGILKGGQVDEFDPRHRLGSISGMSGWDEPCLALAKRKRPVPVGDWSVGPYAADMAMRCHAPWLRLASGMRQAPRREGRLSAMKNAARFRAA